MEEKKFGIHPSPELQKLFQKKPYQGQCPEKAKIIIYGIDANFPEDVETKDKDFFDELKAYLQDGVAFWKNNKYGIHHPFLLPNHPFDDKRKGGRPYHKRFAKLDWHQSYCSECVSFVELLNVPTVGNTNKDEFWKLFKQEQAEEPANRIGGKIVLNSPKLIFLSNEVISKMMEARRKYNENIYWWINENPTGEPKPIRLKSDLDKRDYEVYKITHFTRISDEEIKRIRKCIQDFCKRNYNCDKF